MIVFHIYYQEYSNRILTHSFDTYIVLHNILVTQKKQFYTTPNNSTDLNK